MAQGQQVMPGSEDDAPLLHDAYAGCRAAMVAAAALSHLDKHQRAVGIAQDEVNFSAATPGRPIIARYQLQTFVLQKTQRLRFCRIPDLLGGGARRPRWK